jgi:hypothetical protein
MVGVLPVVDVPWVVDVVPLAGRPRVVDEPAGGELLNFLPESWRLDVAGRGGPARRTAGSASTSRS